MSLPEGAIKSYEDLSNLISCMRNDGEGHFYAVWNDSFLATVSLTADSTLNRSDLNNAEYILLGENVPISNGFRTDIAFHPNAHHYHLFKNFWFAYAYLLKRKAESKT